MCKNIQVKCSIFIALLAKHIHIYIQSRSWCVVLCSYSIDCVRMNRNSMYFHSYPYIKSTLWKFLSTTTNTYKQYESYQLTVTDFTVAVHNIILMLAIYAHLQFHEFKFFPPKFYQNDCLSCVLH